jgi:dipeptidase E
MGETREERIAQFHEENETPVIGLREGAMVRIGDAVATLRGAAGARLFRRGEPAIELASGTTLDGFLPNDRSARR